MNDIKNNINKIETNIEVPADNTDSVNQEHQRDEWGKFLNNKTFKIMKDNFNLLKSNILSLIDKITDSVNTQNTEIKKTNDSLKIVSDKVNDLSNGNLTLPNNVALLNKKNVFTDNVSVKSLSLDNNNIIKETVNNLEVGNATKNINIIGFGEKLLYNGKEIQTGSSQGGGDSSDLITLYSIPLLASTPFRAWNYSFNITPTNLSKAVKPTTTSSQPTGITGKGFKEVHSNYFQLISLPVDSGAGNTAVFKYTFPVPFSKKPEVQATNVNTSRGAYFLIITEITPEYVLLNSNYYSNATYVNLLAFTLDS